MILKDVLTQFPNRGVELYRSPDEVKYYTRVRFTTPNKDVVILEVHGDEAPNERDAIHLLMVALFDDQQVVNKLMAAYATHPSTQN